VFLLEQLHDKHHLFRGERKPFLAHPMEFLPMFRVGEGVGFVAVGLTGLRQQDERRGISRLRAEREIEQDERVDIEARVAEDIDSISKLGRQASAQSKRTAFRKTERNASAFNAKPIITKHRPEVANEGSEICRNVVQISAYLLWRIETSLR